MASAILVVFRESLEAALVVAIVLGYLARSGQDRLRPMAWIGVAVGVGASAAGAVLAARAAEAFEGRAGQVFEAVTMLAGGALILTLVLWIGRTGGSPAALEARVASRIDGAARRGGSAGWSLLLLVALSILREGIETVLFLASAGRAGMLAGAAIGLAAAVAVAAALFFSTRRFSLRGFFTVTNVLLILFAAGLVSRGAHELVEAGVLPPLVERLWDLNPPLRADGGYPALHQNGAVGGVLRGLFGYAASPSLVEVLGWAACVAAAAGIWAVAARRPRGSAP